MRQCKELIDVKGKFQALVESSQLLTSQNVKLQKENEYLKALQLGQNHDDLSIKPM